MCRTTTCGSHTNIRIELCTLSIYLIFIRIAVTVREATAAVYTEVKQVSLFPGRAAYVEILKVPCDETASCCRVSKTFCHAIGVS